MEEDTGLADQRVRNHTVELSLLSGDPAYNSMQFNRCMSFEAHSSLPNRSADSQIWRCMDDSSSDSGLSESAWRNQSFQPFEVEEQATEVTFLKGQLTKKEEECEHLRQIIKELSHARHVVAKTKVEMEEQYVALQKEYLRVVKVCGLARGVSSEAMGRINRLKSELRTSQEDLSRTKRRYRNMAEEQAALKAENETLRRRLALLEQGRLAEDCSACAREYMYATVSLY